MPSDLIFPVGGGHQAGQGGRAVPKWPLLSQAHAAPGSHKVLIQSNLPLCACMAAQQVHVHQNRIWELGRHQHKNPVTPSFMRQVLTAMAQEGREQGHSYLH